MQQMDNSMNHDEDGQEIIQAELVDEMEPGAPWEAGENRPTQPRRRRVRLPVLLFIATCLSTLTVGEYLKVPSGTGWIDALLNGLWYAAPVMTILMCHEMGHFIQCYRYGVYASLPYFIPVPLPPPISPMGTLGAVIVMEPRMGHRKALFDIGITGPLAGLVPTFIFLIIGLHLSKYEPRPKEGMLFGDPLLLQFLASKILGPMPPGEEILTHPMAFAGWVGLLVTSLNLMPIGQLDGGHVLYAMLRRKANKIASYLLFAAVVIVALRVRELGSWIPMLILVYFVVGTTHPPTANDDEPLGVFRTILGWLTLAFIIVGFTPTPIRVLQ
jgi:membrane-associated protease RseP (regulator of RpoE activity)